MMKEPATVIQQMRRTAHELCAYHERSMCAAIAMGMHGFKRWHRCESRHMFEAHLHLANDLGNYAGGDFGAAYDRPAWAAPSGIQAHIEGCIVFLADKLKALSVVNNEFRALSGTDLPCGQKLQARVFRSLVKMRRWKQRFEDVKWMPHDIYVFDAALHAKMKDREEKMGMMER